MWPLLECPKMSREPSRCSWSLCTDSRENGWNSLLADRSTDQNYEEIGLWIQVENKLGNCSEEKTRKIHDKKKESIYFLSKITPITSFRTKKVHSFLSFFPSLSCLFHFLLSFQSFFHSLSFPPSSLSFLHVETRIVQLSWYLSIDPLLYELKFVLLPSLKVEEKRRKREKEKKEGREENEGKEDVE